MARKDDFIVRDGILLHYVGLDTVVNIPDYITGIARGAFKDASYNGRNYVEEIYLPQSIDKISVDAFDGLVSLVKIEVDVSNKTFSSRNGVLYSKDGKTLISFPKGRNGGYLIPEGVERIYNKAFSHCSSLNNLILPTSLKEIEGRAFLETPNLLEIIVNPKSPYFVFIDSTLFSKDGKKLIRFFGSNQSFFEVPSCIEEIGSYAFSNMSNLCDLVIPSNVKKIGKGAFNNCSSLSSLRLLYEEGRTSQKINGTFYLPERLCEIQDEVFSNCSLMEKIQLPSTIKRIGNKAFFCAISLKEIEFNSYLREIGEEAFSHCDSILSFNIPYFVSKIGEGAFSFCQSLKEIKVDEENSHYVCDNGILFALDTKTILQVLNGQDSSFIVGDMVSRIGKSSFALCNDVTNVLCSKSVKTVGKYAFENCVNLQAISFQGVIKHLGEGCFKGCLRLSEVNNLGEITEIKDETFSSCASLKHIALPKTIKLIGRYAFNNCSSLMGVLFGDELSYIDDGAFNYCSNLTEVTLGKNISVLSSCFSNCKNLQTVNLNEGLTYITSYAFYDCESLCNIALPLSLCRIGYNAFDGCSAIKEININENVFFIGKESFSNMPSLTSINVVEENKTFSSENGSLLSKDKDALLKLPEGMEGEYTIPSSVTSIQWLACSNLGKLTKLYLPSSIEDMENNAFDYTNEDIIIKI